MDLDLGLGLGLGLVLSLSLGLGLGLGLECSPPKTQAGGSKFSTSNTWCTSCQKGKMSHLPHAHDLWNERAAHKNDAWHIDLVDGTPAFVFRENRKFRISSKFPRNFLEISSKFRIELNRA